MWVLDGLIAALLAGVNTVLAKWSAQGLSASKVMAIRTAAMLVVVIWAVSNGRLWSDIAQINGIDWLLLVVSGILTTAAWFFYLGALRNGSVNGVAAIDKSTIL